MRRRSVFLSYRRNDTAAMAGRVHDRLKQVLPEGGTFLDVTGINPGADFRRSIEAALARCDVVLAFIGPNWADGGRILEERDFVRAEIAISLERNVPIVPVLVENTAMPDAEALPANIRALHFKQGIRIAHATFDRDVEHLLEEALGLPAVEHNRIHSHHFALLARLVAGAAGMLLLLVLLAVAHNEITGRALNASIGDAVTVALIPASALAGAALGWLRHRGRRSV